MSRHFQRWIGIDYSGAATADTRLPGLRVAMVAEAGELPELVGPPTPRARNWTRRELAAWLEARLAEDVPTAVGIDHAFGHPRPFVDAGGHRDWDAWLDAAARDWPADRSDVTVAALRKAGAPVGDASLLRRTDAWTSGAMPVFRFDVQGSVATSTHAGLIWLHRLRRRIPPPRLHVWPFDGFQPPAGASMVAEVFPSLLRRRWPRRDRTVDQHDAWCVAAWLAAGDAEDGLDHHLQPPLPPDVADDARLEGWILGVH
jgi:hypothetical protein